MSFVGYKITKRILYNLWLYRIIAFRWLTFMIFCANNVFVSLFLCLKWVEKPHHLGPSIKTAPLPRTLRSGESHREEDRLLCAHVAATGGGHLLRRPDIRCLRVAQPSRPISDDWWRCVSHWCQHQGPGQAPVCHYADARDESRGDSKATASIMTRQGFIDFETEIVKYR